MEIKYKGTRESKKYTYEFRETLTGREFLALREAANKEGNMSFMTYTHANLVIRLTKWSRPEPVSEDNILKLDLDVYHVLYHTGTKIEADETKGAVAFLAESISPSLKQELASVTENSETPPASKSEESLPEAKQS